MINVEKKQKKAKRRRKGIEFRKWMDFSEKRKKYRVVFNDKIIKKSKVDLSDK